MTELLFRFFAAVGFFASILWLLQKALSDLGEFVKWFRSWRSDVWPPAVQDGRLSGPNEANGRKPELT